MIKPMFAKTNHRGLRKYSEWRFMVSHAAQPCKLPAEVWGSSRRSIAAVSRSRSLCRAARGRSARNTRSRKRPTSL